MRPRACRSRAHEVLVDQRGQAVDRVHARVRPSGSATASTASKIGSIDERRERARTSGARPPRAGRSSTRSSGAASAVAPARSTLGAENRKPWSSRARSPSGESTFTRLAASSMASGSPSRRAVISSHSTRFARSRGSLASRPRHARQRARWPRSGPAPRGRDPILVREAQRRHRVLVLPVEVEWDAAGDQGRAPGAARNSGSPTIPPASTTCSALSSTSNSSLSRSCSLERVERPPICPRLATEGVRDLLSHEFGVGQGRQIDEPHTIGEAG